LEEQREEKFREQYSDDPAGTTFKEIQQIFAVLSDLDQRLSKLNRVLKDMNPERMESIEQTRLLRHIANQLTESTPEGEI